MQYLNSDLGWRNAGEIVVVTLDGTEANVRLVDSSNYQAFRTGRPHRYYGGHYQQSPARIQVPYAGQWYVIVDLGGFVGEVRAGVQVI